MGLIGILAGLALLVGLAMRGWSVLLLAPAAAMVAALLGGEPLLAHWTLRFMDGAAGFIGQYFPLFLLGAVFGKLMEDSGSVAAIAQALMRRLGPRRAMLSVVLAGAAVTYGGVSLFVAFFVLTPMAQAVFRAAGIPRRLMPAAIVLGTSTFTMSALPGTPAIQNAIPMPFFGTTPYAAPGLGLIASAFMLASGLWWLGRAEAAARRAGEGHGGADGADGAGGGEGGGGGAQELRPGEDRVLRERAHTAREFDLAEIGGPRSDSDPGLLAAAAPLLTVVMLNLLMSLWVLRALDLDYLAEPAWGPSSLAAVGGVWSVVVALAGAIAVGLAIHWRRVPSVRDTLNAGATASVLPCVSVASLVGFGAVVAAMPAFGLVRDAVLGLEGGPLVSLAVATNTLAALTGSASGGLTIALDALGATYLARAQAIGLDPALLHRVAVIGCGTLDSLPHNGAVVTLLALCGCTHRESYRDVAMVSIAGALVALVVVIALGSAFGSF